MADNGCACVVLITSLTIRSVVELVPWVAICHGKMRALARVTARARVTLVNLLTILTPMRQPQWQLLVEIGIALADSKTNHKMRFAAAMAPWVARPRGHLSSRRTIHMCSRRTVLGVRRSLMRRTPNGCARVASKTGKPTQSVVVQVARWVVKRQKRSQRDQCEGKVA